MGLAVPDGRARFAANRQSPPIRIDLNGASYPSRKQSGISAAERCGFKQVIMSSGRIDLVVIGAGPAGMIAALRAADLIRHANCADSS
jgi:NADPH-dependent 2,4-dienoyl-CoA reductase/sulfur reductase-like enzyme